MSVVKQAESELNPPTDPATTDAFGAMLRDDGRTPYEAPEEEAVETETKEGEEQEEIKSEAEETATEETEVEETEETEGAEDLGVDLESSETESRAGVADEVEEDGPKLPKRILEAAKTDDVLAARIARAMFGLEGGDEVAEEDEVSKDEMRKQFKALIAEGKDFEALELVTSHSEKRIRKDLEKREIEAKREQAKQRARTLKFIEFTQKYPDWKTYEKPIMEEYRRLAANGLGKAAYEGVSPEDAYLLAKARAQGGPGPRKAAAAKAVQQTKKEGAAATAAPAGANPAKTPTKPKPADVEQEIMRKTFAFIKRSGGPTLLR